MQENKRKQTEILRISTSKTPLSARAFFFFHNFESFSLTVVHMNVDVDMDTYFNETRFSKYMCIKITNDEKNKIRKIRNFFLVWILQIKFVDVRKGTPFGSHQQHRCVGDAMEYKPNHLQRTPAVVVGWWEWHTNRYQCVGGRHLPISRLRSHKCRHCGWATNVPSHCVPRKLLCAVAYTQANHTHTTLR